MAARADLQDSRILNYSSYPNRPNIPYYKDDFTEHLSEVKDKKYKFLIVKNNSNETTNYFYYVIINQIHIFTDAEYNLIHSMMLVYNSMALVNGNSILNYQYGTQEIPEYVKHLYLELNTWKNCNFNALPPHIVSLYIKLAMYENFEDLPETLNFPLNLKVLIITNYDSLSVYHLPIRTLPPELETLILFGVNDFDLIKYLPSTIKNVIIEAEEEDYARDDSDHYNYNYNIAEELNEIFVGNLPNNLENLIYDRSRPIAGPHILDRYNEIDFSIFPLSMKYISINARTLLTPHNYAELQRKLHITHPGCILE